MSTYLNSAKQFFEACETGKGWEACSAFCHPGASFSSQTTVHTMAEVQRGITISTRETLSTLSQIPAIQNIDVQAITELFRAVIQQNTKYLGITLTDF